jgi:hypothetical protein
MAAPKRTEFEREQQLLEIQSMYLRGERQVDIAAKFGLSQPAISRDLATIKARWKNSQLIDMNEAKQRELARVDELEKVYWTAWEKSLGERRKTRQEKYAGAGENGKEHSRASVETEIMLGNPSYLAGIADCVDKRCKIIGLYAPAKQEHTGAGGGPIKYQNATDLTDEQLAAIASSGGVGTTEAPPSPE